MNAEWIFIIAGALSGLAGLYTAISSRRKRAVEADNLTVDSANRLVATAMEQLDYLDREMEKLRRKIGEYRDQLDAAVRTEERLSAEILKLRGKVQTLHDFIIAQGLEPPTGLDT